MIRKSILALLLVFVLQSCNAVKEYEKVAINDPEMKHQYKTKDTNKTDFQVY